MRYTLTIILSIILFSSCGEQNNKKELSLVWTMDENNVEWGIYENTFQLINHSNDSIDGNWAIFFNQQPAAVKSIANPQIAIEQISSTYYKMRPTAQYKKLAPKDTLHITFRCEGSILKSTSAPEGAYCVWLDEGGHDVEIQEVPIVVTPFNNDKQWARKDGWELPYPYGDVVFEDNVKFVENIELRQIDIFPSVKKNETLVGKSTLEKEINLKYDNEFESEAKLLKEKLAQLYNCTFSESAKTIINLKKKKIANTANAEHYKLSIRDNNIEIIAEYPHAIFNGTQTLLSIIGVNVLPLEVQNISLEDYPDLAHRGFMLDIARNFTAKENVLKLIDVLSTYKLSVFHLHLTDDESWRLEIPGIEELTTVGAARGHTYDERDMLYPAYGGGWKAYDETKASSGFYTRQDFIDILKYAKARHIKIVPEIDLPAHARAAIKATTARYYKYIDTDKAKAEEYLLEDFSDTSVYLSAQSYTDNAINVALPSAYTFVQKVIDEVEKMYKEAGLKLETLHLGGDEVPQGAWTASEVCKQFMAEKKFTEVRELKDYFIDKTLKMLEAKDIQMASWQEVGLFPDESVNKRFANRNVLSYSWNTVPDWGSDEIPYRLANAGFPVILCNLSNFYFDLSYNKHEEEPGAYWGGFVNEFNSFNVLPFNMYYSIRKDMSGAAIDFKKDNATKLALASHAKENIKGVQAQVWAETIRNYDMVEHYIFPKIFGLVERGWNAHPSWETNPVGKEYDEALKLYNAKINKIGLPLLAKKGASFRIALPGIKLENGKLEINSPIAGSKTYYTTDGSKPTEKSILWTKVVDCDATTIRAKTFYLGKESAATLLKK